MIRVKQTSSSRQRVERISGPQENVLFALSVYKHETTFGSFYFLEPEIDLTKLLSWCKIMLRTLAIKFGNLSVIEKVVLAVKVLIRRRVLLLNWTEIGVNLTRVGLSN